MPTTLLNSPSMVIVGAWNSAIIQPSWLGRQIYGVPEGDEFPVVVEMATTPKAPPRFTIGDIAYVPSDTNLMVFSSSVDMDALGDMENKVINILRALPHTPIVAFGQNFEFVDNDPGQQLLEIFDLNDNLSDRINSNFELASTSIKSTLNIEGHQLNLTRGLEGGRVVISFNFHYQVRNAEQAVENMGDTFANNYRFATDILENYQMTLEQA